MISVINVLYSVEQGEIEYKVFVGPCYSLPKDYESCGVGQISFVFFF